MSYKCIVCGKKPSAGKKVSHSKRATVRSFRPNLHKMRIKFEGSVQRSYVCSKCLKANKIEKVL